MSVSLCLVARIEQNLIDKVHGSQASDGGPGWTSDIRLQLHSLVHPHTPQCTVSLLKVSIDTFSADLGTLGRAGAYSLESK